MCKILHEAEFLIRVDQNTYAPHKVQIIDHENEDQFLNRFELTIEDLTRQSENSDSRFSDFSYDKYETVDDMLEYLQETDIESELEDWSIDFKRNEK